jgi:hypothetical protein
MNQPFVLVSNAARESRILLLVIVWVFVVLPVVGLICWRVATAFGLTAASIAGGGLAITLIVLMVLSFPRKERYTLTVEPEAVRLVDGKGKLLETLAPRALELEIACHEYVGRGTMRIPVVVLRGKTHELTIGANSPEEPPTAARRVPAPRFLIERAELPRLIAAVKAAQGSAKERP